MSLLCGLILVWAVPAALAVPSALSASSGLTVSPPLTSATDFITGLPSCGPGPVGLIDDGTSFFVADFCTASTYKFSASTGGSASGVTAVQNGFTHGLAKSGNAYFGVATIFQNVTAPGVYTFDPVSLARGGVSIPAPCGGDIRGLAADPKGPDLFLTGACGVFEIHDPLGQASITTISGDNADGVAVSSDGSRLWLAVDSARVVERDRATGALLATIATGHNPDGIAIASGSAPAGVANNIFVNDNDGTILRIDPDSGNTFSIVGTGGTRGDFVTTGPDGYLYVTQTDSVVKITPNFFESGQRWVGPTSTCNRVGQMVTYDSLGYDKWNLHYGISKCEGLIISDVSLNSRLMAERMNLPYLDLQTCTGQSPGVPSSVSNCGLNIFRHIALQPGGAEPQADPSAFTDVQLVSPGGRPEVFYSDSPPSSPCNGNSLCKHVNIQAKYRISLSPPTGTDSDQYLTVTERYEFYQDFKESHEPPALACEPSQEKIAGILGPLPDCGRWKPVVFYQYHMGASKQILVSLNAAERLHYTPDSLALRGSTFIRDCDGVAPQGGCHGNGTPIGAQFEVFHDPVSGSELNPLPHETVVRAVQATDSGTVGNQPGRYDNIHLTPKSEVGPPSPPPGCPECAHMHWRWGADLTSRPEFGNGKPLLGDGEPAAGPTNARQQLDVAAVAYHSEELSPRNFMDLVKGANSNQLDMHQSTSTAFTGGSTQGSETLNYPAAGCYAASALRSWGQCGQVVWLSATAIAQNVNAAGVGDEDNDTFFSFGGFFCGTCSDGQYADFLGLKPKYSPNQNRLTDMRQGKHLKIAFGNLSGPLPSGVDTQLFDILPKGMTSITVKIDQVQSSQFSHQLVSCTNSVLGSGQTLVACDIKQPTSSNDLPPPCVGIACITVEGNLSTTAGNYENVVHAVWTNPSGLIAGNLRQIDPIVVH